MGFARLTPCSHHGGNKDVQKESDRILSDLVNKAIGFGYPNVEELQLGVITELKIDDQIKKQTQLSYSSGTGDESLPSSYNGLGYKNLIRPCLKNKSCTNGYDLVNY